MLVTFKGRVQGGTVVVDDGNLKEYDGKEAIVTILDFPYKGKSKEDIDWDSFSVPTERGKDVDSYMREMRENRLTELLYSAVEQL